MQSLGARSTPVFGSRQCSMRGSQRGMQVRPLAARVVDGSATAFVGEPRHHRLAPAHLSSPVGTLTRCCRSTAARRW